MIWRFLASLLRPLIEKALAYFKGRSDAKRKAELDDYENAADIRNRIDRDLDRVHRDFDDAGWRDR